MIWGYADERQLFELIKYYVRRGEIFALTRGLYAWHDYTEQELRRDSALLYQIANKLIPNSYISLYTALKAHGLIDQYYDAIYSVAPRTVTRTVRGVRFEYRQVRERILWSEWGINQEHGARIAGPERAILDTWYREPGWNLSRTSTVNALQLKKGAMLYGGRVQRRVLHAEY